MSENRVVSCLLFGKPGPHNTQEVLEAASMRYRELGLKSVVIATSTGRTVEEALKYFDPKQDNITAVRYVTGFSEPGVQPMSPETQQSLTEKGVRIVTAAHAFGGVGRGVRNKLSTYQVDEIMAYTLRIFGHGVKVCVEVSLMATDNGAVRPDEDILVLAGTGRGADTALVVRPANSHQCLESKVREIIAKPWNI